MCPSCMVYYSYCCGLRDALACRWIVIRDEVLKQEDGREMLFSGRPDNHGVEWISDNIRAVLQVRLPPSSYCITKASTTSPKLADRHMTISDKQ